VHLRDSESDAEFRAELCAWLADAVPTLPAPPDAQDWPGRRAFDTVWQSMLFEAGYAGVNWPSEYGGRGATPTQHLIFLEEAAAAKAPDVGVGFVGQMHAGPTLIAEGTPEQQAHHLRGILTGEHVWCQGFSEPGAGSDLASLRTRAIRDGDDYVVSGQKIWTSHAMVADYCELLVRTDPDVPKHKGITWLILPMGTPGIDVRPLMTVQGSADFEKSTLESVTNARASVGRMTIDANKAPETAEKLEEFQKTQGAFGGALQRLLVVAERYPDLKASAGFRDLQTQLEGTENRIAVERGRFNDVVKEYNTGIRKVPAVFFAGMLGFHPKPYFQAESGAEKAPDVNFDFGGKSGSGK
jgi:alkylation response protein AidB-like acyl-CoA dehydrogenase